MIEELAYRYAHAIDSRDLELLRDVFTPDATEDFRRLGHTLVRTPDGLRIAERILEPIWER